MFKKKGYRLMMKTMTRLKLKEITIPVLTKSNFLKINQLKNWKLIGNHLIIQL